MEFVHAVTTRILSDLATINESDESLSGLVADAVRAVEAIQNRRVDAPTRNQPVNVVPYDSEGDSDAGARAARLVELMAEVRMDTLDDDSLDLGPLEMELELLMGR